MSDATTQAGSPSADHANAAVGTSEATEQNLDHTQGGEHGEAEEGEALETEEVEIGGRKYAVPKEVARGVLREADYTRKTQELADHRKALEAERNTHGEKVTADRQLINDEKEIVVLNWQIDRLQGLSPEEFRSLPADRQNELMFKLQQLQAERSQKAQAYSQKIEARNSEAERQRATRMEQARADIAREVEGWTPAMQDTLRAAAIRDLGATPQDFDVALQNPRIMRLLHLAHIGHQSSLKAKAAAASNTVQPQPTRTVSGGSPSASTGLSDRMSTEQWMKNRTAHTRKR